MDKIILIPSVTLALIMVIIYSFCCYRTKKKFSIATMINIIFDASGIICGLFLILSIFFSKIKELIVGIDMYIFISGLTVFAVSLQSFYKDAIKNIQDG